MSFKVGERVQVIAPHVWEGRPYRGECEVGDTGVIGHGGPDTYKVDWDNPRKTTWSLINAECLAPEDGGPTEEEVARLFGLAPDAPCPHCNGTGKAS